MTSRHSNNCSIRYSCASDCSIRYSCAPAISCPFVMAAYAAMTVYTIPLYAGAAPFRHTFRHPSGIPEDTLQAYLKTPFRHTFRHPSGIPEDTLQAYLKTPFRHPESVPADLPCLLKRPSRSYLRQIAAALLLCILCCSPAAAQSRMFSWRSHLSHSKGVQLLDAGGTPIYASDAGMICLQNNVELNKANALHYAGISALYYAPQKDIFLIGYDDGNIEIAPRSVLSTLSPLQSAVINDIKNDRQRLHRKINRFVIDSNGKCAAAADFGIVEIDIDRQEIKDDFTINPAGKAASVRDLTIFGEWWVAAADTGLLYCGVNNSRWSYFGAWTHLKADTAFVSLAVCGDTLFALTAGGELYRTGDMNTFAPVRSGVQMICADGKRLWLAADGHLYDIKGNTPAITLPQCIMSPQCVMYVGDTLYIADRRRGLWKYSEKRDGGDFIEVTAGRLPSNAALLLAENRGGVWAAGSGFIARQTGGVWEYDTSALLNRPVALVVHPDLSERAWVATAERIVEYRAPNQFETLWEHAGISAMAASASGELLVGCSYSDTPLTLLNADGSLTQPNAPELAGLKIKAIQRYGSMFYGVTDEAPAQIFAYAPASGQFACYPVSLRNDFSPHNPVSVSSLLLDREGKVWLATNKGVAVYASNNFLTDTLQGRKVQTVSDMPEYASYLLEYDTVTAAIVDGGNRKWFGTASAGIFLQSADGSTSVQTLNENGSPLPSNRIVSIASNGVTGETFIATGRGVMSFIADATTGAESFSNVKIYPNPARPQTQYLVITGLMEDAEIKITDAAGRTVHSGSANGGTLTWDLNRWRGGRVETGVYFVFMLHSGASQQQVGKFLVVK